MWEIDDVPGKGRKVTVTLHKATPTMAMHHWNSVCEGEPTIDTRKFGPPIMGVSPLSNSTDVLIRKRRVVFSYCNTATPLV